MSHLSITCVVAIFLIFLVFPESGIIFVFAIFIKKIHLPFEKKKKKRILQALLFKIELA